MARVIHGLVLVSILLAAGPVGSEPEDAKRAAILELIEVTGSGVIGEQVAQTLSVQIKAMFPDVPAELWDELFAMFDAEEINAQIIPIYARHFSLEEVNGLLAFYRTPLGAKILEKTPAIARESMMVGQAWGQATAEKLIARLAERGFEPIAL